MELETAATHAKAWTTPSTKIHIKKAFTLSLALPVPAQVQIPRTVSVAFNDPRSPNP